MRVAPIEVVALLSSVGCYYASSRMRARKEEAHDEVAMLRSIPDLPIGVASVMLPNPDTKRLVWLRGVILPLSSVDDLCDNSDDESSSSTVDTALVSDNTTDLKPVVLVDRTWHICKRTGTEIIGGTSKMTKTKLISESKKQVPFIMARQIPKPCNEYVFVNWDGNEDLVPLKQVSCSRKQLLNLSQLDSELTVEEEREEKALSQGTVVTALGLLSSDKGILTIEPSEAHPFFLTTTSKEQMIEELLDDIETTLSHKERLYREMSFAFAGFLFGVSLILRTKD
ncbi:E3 ubiquitin-protein ligase SPL2-like [Silene latifolia]|uniref:E3 ubiquitin-protein ligase SPL2-like n=1 Tax=Silene latifolia TaxID=37657 RepID=UPI003D78331E